ncbi:MAG: Gfo/Idh/MocA family protein [Candidatus Dormibacteraceae bacterium]
MTLRWGLVGPGRSADTLVAPAIAADPNSELCWVVGRDQVRAEAFAKKHGLPRSGTSYESMLSDPAIDAVVITTPNAQHPDQVAAAARAGKHVLCDKPLGPTEAEAARALDACRMAGVKLGMNFQTRRHSCFVEARRVIHSGAIGEVRLIQVDASPGDVPHSGWRAQPALASRGAMNNIAIHIYDLLCYLLDSEVTEVAALLDTGQAADLERMPLVLLRFASGALAFANGNQLTPMPLNDIVIHGTRGRIDGRGITRPQTTGSMRVVTAETEVTSSFSSQDCYEATLGAFTADVLAGRDPSPSGLDGLRSVQLTDAIARAARERRVIQIPIRW